MSLIYKSTADLFLITNPFYDGFFFNVSAQDERDCNAAKITTIAIISTTGTW